MTCLYEAAHRLVDEQTGPAPPEVWRGPNGYTLLSWEADFRPGGASRLCVRSPAGLVHWVEGAHLEIVEPERVVFSGDLALEGERFGGTGGNVTFRLT